MSFIHPTAIIDDGAEIGARSKIWHFCHIMPGAKIGEDCVLGQNVFIASGVVLGRNVHVQNNVSIYEGVICEDDVFLGPSMVFTNIKNPRSSYPRKGAYEKTIIRRGATIGANATIVCGGEIGAHAFVAGGAVVTKAVEPYVLVGGCPAKPLGWMSEKGGRLLFDQNGQARCPETGEQYELVEGQVKKLS